MLLVCAAFCFESARRCLGSPARSSHRSCSPHPSTFPLPLTSLRRRAALPHDLCDYSLRSAGALLFLLLCVLCCFLWPAQLQRFAGSQQTNCLQRGVVVGPVACGLHSAAVWALHMSVKRGAAAGEWRVCVCVCVFGFNYWTCSTCGRRQLCGKACAGLMSCWLLPRPRGVHL